MKTEDLQLGSIVSINNVEFEVVIDGSIIEFPERCDALSIIYPDRAINFSEYDMVIKCLSDGKLYNISKTLLEFLKG